MPPGSCWAIVRGLLLAVRTRASQAQRLAILAIGVAAVVPASPFRAVAGGASGPIVADEVVRLLERESVPFDDAALRLAAAAAMLKAADPGGELLDADAVRRWATNRSVSCATQWPDDLAYVRLNGCYDGDAAELGGAVRSIATTNCLGLILDLRGAGGCSTAAVAAVAGLMVGEGGDAVGVRRAQPATTEVVRAVGPALEPMPPVILLTDRRTRGAAEGLVWALRGRPGLLVLGERTSGDGAAREPLAIGGGYAALLATGRYVRRDGEPVPADGVPPGLEVLGEDSASAGGSRAARADAPDRRRCRSATGRRPAARAKSDGRGLGAG